jgi:limonene-1,2-epoxide hydrolase
MESVEISSTVEPNRATAERLMKAMREQDYETMSEVFAPDVVINSPITASFQFHGREDAVALMKLVRAGMEDLEHHELLGSGDVWAQRFGARVRGQLLDGMDALRFDAAGQVCAMTVFVRPLPGLTAFAAAVVPVVARRRGLLSSIALRLLIGPLAVMTRHGDRLAAWLLRGSWGIAG